MGESYPVHESHESHENRHEPVFEHEKTVHHPNSQETRHHPQESLEKIKLEIETESQSAESIKSNQELDRTLQNNESEIVINKDSKKRVLADTMQRVRHQLTPPEKKFSKFIHNDSVEKISEIGGYSMARPSGLLSGGLFAFAGSLLLLILVKHYGYEYRFSAFLILFGGGFLFGLLVELFIRLAKGKKPSH